MNKQKRMINKLMPIIVITILTISFTSPVLAYQDNNNKKNQSIVSEQKIKNKKNKRATKKITHNLIQKALENKNYSEWKKILENNKNPQNERLLTVINENNFNRYADAKISAENGDHTELNKLKIELGLNCKIKR